MYLVQGKTMDIICGFKILTREIPIQGFLVETSPMNVTSRILLTSFPDGMTCSGSCRNIGSVLFLHSRGTSSSSSSESNGICTFYFFSVGPKLIPTPSSYPFFFRISGWQDVMHSRLAWVVLNTEP
jgi:hypothetical protein